jgi:lysophosphatidic acid acyltransferase/lysophosphatidylinositol acyltransferase
MVFMRPDILGEGGTDVGASTAAMWYVKTWDFLFWIIRVILADAIFILVLPLLNVMQVFVMILAPLIGARSAYMGHIAASSVSGFCFLLMYEWAGGARVEFSKSALSIPEEEDAILLCNHRSAADFYAQLAFSRLHRRLFYFKYFSKDSIRWVPFFGWGLWLSSHIFVQRDWFRDQKTIERKLEYYIKGRYPAWITSFPEGSRISDSNREKCIQFCEKNGLKTLKHVLYPRTKGFVASVQAFRDSHIKVIYDMTVAYQRKCDRAFGVPLALLDMVLGTSYAYRVHVDVQRFEIKDLPLDEAGLSQWLIDRYYKKDNYLEDLRLKWESEGNGRARR